MGKRIVLGIVGVVLGMIGGMLLMRGIHGVSAWLYPAPANLNFASTDPAMREQINAWFESLPVGAFLLALVAHGLGSMSGAAIATLVTGRRTIVPALVVGVLFTIAGILNVLMVPHPAWFPFVDIPLYLILAYVAYRLLRRAPAKAKDER